MRILAILERQRWSRAPGLPTAIEQGFATTAGSARGFALPAATPEALQSRWEEAVRATAADPEFRALAERDYLIVRHLDRAAMTRFVAEQLAAYGAMCRDTRGAGGRADPPATGACGETNWPPTGSLYRGAGAGAGLGAA